MFSSCSNSSDNHSDSFALNNKNQDLSNNDTVTAITKRDTLPWENQYINKSPVFFNPSTFLTATKVYAKADTNSRVLYTLKFNTEIELIKTVKVSERITYKSTLPNQPTINKTEYTNTVWCQINIANDTGYILKENVAEHKLIDETNDILFISFPVSKPWMSKMFFYSTLEHKITNVLQLDLGREVSSFYISELEHSEWKNLNFLIRITSIQGFCGGGQGDIFLAVTKDSILVLAETYRNYNEDDLPDDDEYTSVYLPVKEKTSSTIELQEASYQSGNSKYILNKNVNLPIDKLMVEEVVNIKIVRDNNEKIILDKKGYYKGKKIKGTTIYQWDGTKLIIREKKDTTSYFSAKLNS